MKAQLLVSQENKMIYGVVSGKGKTHDFKMFKDSKTRIPIVAHHLKSLRAKN